MRPWAEALTARGYAVEVPLLPGHGTRWQDLNTVAWTAWYDTASAALDRLLASCEAVVVASLSMGGSVALRLAEQRPADVAGIVLVNPFVSSTRKELLALPVLQRVVPSLAGVVNDMKKPGQDEHGYPRLPLKGLFQVTRMWKAVVPDLPKVTAPLLYFQSLRGPRHRPVVEGHRALGDLLPRRHLPPARGELPRRDPRPRRRDHLHGDR